MVKRMRTLEITNMEASNLKNVRYFRKMDVYGVVSVEGNPQDQQTPVVKKGGTNPAWNFSMKFTIDVDEAKKKDINLLFQFKSEHKFRKDKHIGEVEIPIRELLDTFDNGKQPIQHLLHRALTTSAAPSSRIKTGELNFSYKFYKIKKDPANSKPPPTAEGKFGSTTLRTAVAAFLSAFAGAAGSNVGTEAFSFFGFPNNPPRYCRAPRWGPLSRRFAASIRVRTRDHLLKQPAPPRPTFFDGYRSFFLA